MSGITLHITNDYDFDAIGISSHEKDYRVAWSLNTHLGLSLVHLKDLVVSGRLNTSTHPVYRYEDPVKKMVYTLFDNKTENGYLLSDLQQFDYVLKIEGLQAVDQEEIIQKLKQTPLVNAVLHLDVERLKSKDMLVFE
ncbi:MAG: IPExxxVDY family protein [Flavobacteriales bacterium]